MSISPRVSVPVVKYEQSKHTVLIKKIFIFYFIFYFKREKPLDSGVKPQDRGNGKTTTTTKKTLEKPTFQA